jgi:autotransporter-associated beta strand protein
MKTIGSTKKVLHIVSSVPRFAILARSALILGLGSVTTSAQVTLTGTSYSQDFNSIGMGLPTGWNVRTGASSSALGTAAVFVSSKTTWATATGQFANTASANSPSTSSDSTTVQGNDTDRAISIQQSGSFGDPGASINFNFNASSVTFSGIGTALSLELQDVNPAQGRLTTWSIQYGIGTSPSTWTTITTWTDPNIWGSSTITVSGSSLSALSGQTNVWIRVVALTSSTGSSSRNKIALDDFSMTYASTGSTPKIVITLPGELSPNAGDATAQTAGTPFDITLTATTDGTTIDTTYTGTKSIVISGPTGSPSYPATVDFTSGVGTANITLTKAETTTITATDGTIAGTASSSLLVNPGTIASYLVVASSPQNAETAFNVVVTAKDANSNTVTTDSSTVLTMTSDTGNVQFDSNGDGTFGDNTKQLSNGTFTISAKDDTVETAVITATDENSKTGSTASITVAIANATAILWSSSSGSAWLTGGNWTGGAVPDETQVAQFGVNPTSGTTGVGINNGTAANQFVGAIEVTSDRNANLLVGNSSGGTSGTLTMNGVIVNGIANVIIRNNSSQNFTIQNNQGSSSTTTMGLVLGNPVANKVILDGSGNIFITSIISGTDKTLTLAGSGSGSLTLSGANTYSGGTTVSTGTLKVLNTTGSGTGSGAVLVNSGATLAGTGSISGAVSVTGTISPGNSSIGTLTLGTAPTLSGTAAMEINKSGATLTADKIVLSSGALAYGGTLSVTASGDALTGGEVFDLFDASSFTGSFTTTTLPTLSSGLNWYLGGLATDGTLKVNRAPVTTTDEISRNGGTSGTKVTIAELLSNDTDADGDSMSLIGFSATSAQGATISSSGAFLVYKTTSPIDVNDSFTYTNSDGFGGISVGTVTVTTTGVTTQTRQLESVSAGEGSFYGVPGTSYTVQYSETMEEGDWHTLMTVTTDGSGLASFTDPGPLPDKRYYRITYP